MTLTARDRLKHLLRDYADAHDDYDPTPPSPTAGNTTLPGRWNYFKELSTWLNTMRTCTCKPGKPHHPTCTRPMFNHLNERYIRPHARTELIRWHNKHLPPNSERATHHHTVTPRKTKTTLQAAPYAGTTLIARWHPWTRADLYNAALDWLLTHMHNGDTTRINLPPDLRDATPDPPDPKRNPRNPERERIAA